MTTESEPMLRTASGCDAPSGKASCAGVADQPSAGKAADGSASVGVAAGKPAIRDGRPADGTADGAAAVELDYTAHHPAIQRVKPQLIDLKTRQ